MDDEAVILIALKMKLKKTLGPDYLVESAYNGRQALEIVQELSDRGVAIDLIITDWLMPGLKGDDLLRSVRKQHPAMKGILITGQADRDSIEAVKKEGLARAVFSKPWNEEKLLTEIMKCLE